LARGGVDVQFGLELIGHEAHSGAAGGPAHSNALPGALVVLVTAAGVLVLECERVA